MLIFQLEEGFFSTSALRDRVIAKANFSKQDPKTLVIFSIYSYLQPSRKGSLQLTVVHPGEKNSATA